MSKIATSGYHKIQIALEKAQYQALKKRQINISELVRDLIRAWLEGQA